MIPFSGPTRISSRHGPPTTWSPTLKDSSIALSGGNLHVVKNSNAQPAGGRSIASRNTGKFHAEFQMIAVLNSGTTDTSLGIVNPTAVVGGGVNHVGSVAGGIGLGSGGPVYLNGSVIATISPFVSGDYVIQEWDENARKIWWCVYHSGAYGPWNGGGTANPATGVGGYDFSSITGPHFAAYAMQQITSEFIANFGASAYFKTPSAGFGVFG